MNIGLGLSRNNDVQVFCSHTATAALLVHLLLGCCWHHDHGTFAPSGVEIGCGAQRVAGHSHIDARHPKAGSPCGHSSFCRRDMRILRSAVPGEVLAAFRAATRPCTHHQLAGGKSNKVSSPTHDRHCHGHQCLYVRGEARPDLSRKVFGFSVFQQVDGPFLVADASLQSARLWMRVPQSPALPIRQHLWFQVLLI